MQIITVIAPSHWASAIVNCDYSGLTDQESDQVKNFLTRQGFGLADCLTCEDFGFCWHHDAMVECPLGSDCQTYFFPLKD